ncbi:MAG: T9SS type A sorting domain-containing protein [Draconibacterium sp.]
MGRFTNHLRTLFVLLFIIAGSSLINAQTYSWEQIGSDMVDAGSFGKSVSFNSDGTIMAIGAPSGTSGGYVSLYERSGESWSLIDTVRAAGAGNSFGRYTSLSSDGTILAVGAPGTGAGYVKVYENTGGSLVQIGKILGDVSGDQFGICVSLNADGTMVAVGAYSFDGGGAATDNRGRTRVYKYTTNWDPIGQDIDGVSGDLSGWSVSLSGDGTFLAVGAYRNSFVATDAGKVRVFNYNSGTDNWDAYGSDINGLAENDRLGASLSFNSDASILAIGAYDKKVGTWVNTGCVRVYQYSGDWTPIGSDINGGVAGEQFGKFVDISSDGTMIIAGAPLSNVAGNSVAGRARIYKNDGGSWQPVGQTFEGEAVNDGLGYSVAINNDGSSIVIGSDASDVVRTYDLKTVATWTGDTNGEWHTASNWSDNTVPDANTNVIIPAGLTNYPTLTEAAECFNLTIESSAAGTGSLIGQSNLTVNGTTTIQSYLTGNKWHLISSPAPGQSVASFLATNTGIPEKDKSGTLRRAMADYNEPGNLWNDYFTSAQGGNMEPGKGFEVLTDVDGTIEFTGSLQGTDLNYALSRTGEYGWNSVGNPFTSAISINSASHPTNNFITVNTDNLDPLYATAYFWEQTNSEYTPVDNEGGEFNASVGQAFMVKVKTDATQVQFTTAMQTHVPVAVLKDAQIGNPGIKLIAELSGQRSATKVNFKDGMSEGLDVGYDAGVFKTSFNLYTKLVEDNGVDFALQYLPSSLLRNSEIAVGINAKSRGEITFSAETLNLPVGTQVVLEDRLKGVETSLINGEVYTTQLETDEASTGRFFLHTKSATTGIEDNLSASFKVYQANNRIVISGIVNGKTNAYLFDAMGRQMKSIELQQSPVNYISTSELKSGIYLLRIQHEGGLFTQKVPVSR